MKNTRSLGKKFLCLLLCCAMLSCTAFAASPEKIQVGDVVITVNAEEAGLLTRAERHVFVETSGTCTFSRPFTVSGTCREVNGNHLYFGVINDGDTDLNIKLTITAGEHTVILNDILTPEDLVYERTVDSLTDGGLTCSFTLEITARRSGQTGYYDVYVAQTNK